MVSSHRTGQCAFLSSLQHEVLCNLYSSADVDRDSIVGAATHYGLGSLGIQSLW
jgi:hypothetical protein